MPVLSQRLRRWLRLFRQALLSTLVAPLVAGAAQPELRFDDPFVATVWRIGTSGDTVVGGLSSGSLAVWRLGALDQPRLLHLPVRNEERRRAHPVAISPDGTMVAYGVPPEADALGKAKPRSARIYVVDAVSLRIQATIDRIETRAQDLKFSNDGTYLAAALSNGCGLRVWRTADWSLFWKDDAGHDGRNVSADDCTQSPVARDGNAPDTLSLAFPSAGKAWLVTSGLTGIRAYAKTAESPRPMLYLPADKLGITPDGVAVSPDGTRVAIGDRRSRQTSGGSALKVVIVGLDPTRWSIRELNLRAEDGIDITRLDPTRYADARQFNLARVAWGKVSDSEWLLAAGTLPCSAASADTVVGRRPAGLAELCAVGWPVDRDFRKPRLFPVGTEQTNDIALSSARSAVLFASDRGLVSLSRGASFATMGEAIGEGWQRQVTERAAADLRDSGFRSDELLDFAVSDNAAIVRLQPYPDGSPVQSPIVFDLSTLNVEQATVPGIVLHAPANSDAAIEPLESWVNSARHPRIGGKEPSSSTLGADIYRAAIALPQGPVAVVSANYLRLLSTSSDPIELCSVRLLAEGFRLNASTDGRMLVVAHGDGTLRWYRIQLDAQQRRCTLQNIVSVHLRRQAGSSSPWAWVAWKPSTGEFAADARAKGILQWQIVNENCQLATVPFGELTRLLYDRAAVQDALADSPATSASPLGQALDDRCSAYRTTVLSPRVHARWETRDITFKLRVSGSATRATPMLVTLGGTERLVKIFGGRTYGSDEPLPIVPDKEYEVAVRLPTYGPRSGADFHVCFEVSRDRDCHLLTWAGADAPARPRKLWTVLVGVSDYGINGFSDTRSLRFAQNDVMDLAGVFLADQTNQRIAIERGLRMSTDYSAMSIELFVAPLPLPETQDELAQLRARPGVTSSLPTAAGIYRVIETVAERISKEGSPEDLFLLYFSGHGMAAPIQQVKGGTVLLLPSNQQERPFLPESDDFLDSAELLNRLEKVVSSKLLIFDACRTAPFDPRALPFDPGKMRSEFENRVPSAAILFSTSPGIGSQETSKYTFSRTRGEERGGNGVFTYLLLTELTRELRKEELVGASDPRQRLSVQKLGSRVEESFENARDRDPIAFKQRPQFIPAHVADPVYIRTMNIAQ